MAVNLNDIFEAVKEASQGASFPDDNRVNEVLLAVADEAMVQSSYIIMENEKDLQKMEVGTAKYENLRLTLERLRLITDELRSIVKQQAPVGRELSRLRDNEGVLYKRVASPLGVVAFVYEARCDVALRFASLAIKSGNGVVLKCGSEAWNTNRAFLNIFRSVLEWFDINPHLIELIPHDRRSMVALLNAIGYVDLIIPYGSNALVDYVSTYATVPVISTYHGMCHIYFDAEGDVKKAAAILGLPGQWAAKENRLVDCLIIHESKLDDLPLLCEPLRERGVIIYADERALVALNGYYPNAFLKLASMKSYKSDFEGVRLAVKTVSFFDDALEHIRKYSGSLCDCIVSENEKLQQLFFRVVDSACLFANIAPDITMFDRVGVGSVVGVSTQKLHVRGVIRLEELNTYKWIIEKTDKQ